MSIRWQRITMVVPFDDAREEEPANWDWARVADMPDEPRLDDFSDVADRPEDLT